MMQFPLCFDIGIVVSIVIHSLLLLVPQEPDICDQSLGHRDFVVMASDGLWDVLSNQEVTP